MRHGRHEETDQRDVHHLSLHGVTVEFLQRQNAGDPTAESAVGGTVSQLESDKPSGAGAPSRSLDQPRMSPHTSS